MGKRNGFTLIELLVVIAIIALLMSVLLPALKRVQAQAKDVMDRSNLRQWGVIFKLYADDNDGYFSAYGFAGEWADAGRWWCYAMEDYYAEEDLLLCPMAEEKRDWPGDPAMGHGGVYGAWFYDGGSVEPIVSSYGGNGWLYNPPPEALPDKERHPPENFWRRPYVKGAAYVPALLDGLATTGWPKETAIAPEYNGQMVGNDDMMRFCFNRHNGHNNGVFLDQSVRKIKLRELWKLRWHRKWDTLVAAPGQWPEWLQDLNE